MKPFDYGITRVGTHQGKSEKKNFSKVRKLSENFGKCRRILVIWLLSGNYGNFLKMISFAMLTIFFLIQIFLALLCSAYIPYIFSQNALLGALPYWFKASFLPKIMGDFLLCKMQKILLHKMTFNLCEVTLTTEKLGKVI